MAPSLSDLKGRVAYPNDFDRKLEPGKKATGAGSALGTGKVVSHTNSTGLWAQATSGDTGRVGVIPNIYWGKDVNTDASDDCVVLTGIGAEVYAEASGTIKPGAKCVVGDDGTFKAWSSGIYAAVYTGKYGEGSAGEPPTDVSAGQAGRFRLERG